MKMILSKYPKYIVAGRFFNDLAKAREFGKQYATNHDVVLHMMVEDDSMSKAYTLETITPKRD